MRAKRAMPVNRLVLLPLATLLLLAGCVTPSAPGAMTAGQADAILAELRDIKRLLAETRVKPAESEAGTKVFQATSTKPPSLAMFTA